MVRFCTALISVALAAALSIAGAVSAKELKPKFGDIGGVYYTDVAENREACRQAIKNKIALCRQNTSFVSNTMDRKYPGCLPIFRQQSRGCADHFRSEAYKCQGSGSARIDDFTGFGCTVTATVVEEDGEPERGTGAGRTAEPEDGQAPQTRGSEAGLSPKCAGMQKRSKCWRELASPRGCLVFERSYNPSLKWTWSGACAGGVAVGQGTLACTSSDNSGTATGTLVRGKLHGRWELRFPSIMFVRDKRTGKYVERKITGCLRRHYSHGKVVSANRTSC